MSVRFSFEISSGEHHYLTLQFENSDEELLSTRDTESDGFKWDIEQNLSPQAINRPVEFKLFENTKNPELVSVVKVNLLDVYLSNAEHQSKREFKFENEELAGSLTIHADLFENTPEFASFSVENANFEMCKLEINEKIFEFFTTKHLIVFNEGFQAHLIDCMNNSTKCYLCWNDLKSDFTLAKFDDPGCTEITLPFEFVKEEDKISFDLTIQLPKPLLEPWIKPQPILDDLLEPREKTKPGEKIEKNAALEFEMVFNWALLQLKEHYELFLAAKQTKSDQSFEQFASNSGLLQHLETCLEPVIIRKIKENFYDDRKNTPIKELKRELLFELLSQFGKTDTIQQNQSSIEIAREFSLCENFSLAETFYEQALVESNNDTLQKLEYAQFILKNISKVKTSVDVARELFRSAFEAKSCDDTLIGFICMNIQANTLELVDGLLQNFESDSWKIMCLKALFECKMEEVEKCKELLQKAEKISPNNVFISFSDVLLYFGFPDLSNTFLSLQREKSEEILIQQGKSFVRSQQLILAKECFLGAFRISDEPRATSWAEVALFHQSIGELDEAKSYFLKAYERAYGENSEGLSDRMLWLFGKIFLDSGKFEQALSCFLKKQTALFLRLQAECTYRLNRADVARELLGRSIILNSSNPDSWLLLALIQLGCNQTDQAELSTLEAFRKKMDRSNVRLSALVGEKWSQLGFEDFANKCRFE